MSSVDAQPASILAPAERHLPGEPGLWVFIGGEMLMFSAFFCYFLFARSLDPATFRASSAHLNQILAVINTLLLLTSSWLVAIALEAVRRARGHVAYRCLGTALLCGVCFIFIKAVEWHEKLNAGIGLNANPFYTLYYVYTGIHAAHVVIGLVILMVMMHKIRTGAASSYEIAFVEGGASYWHMVDLLWIALFALLYLVR